MRSFSWLTLAATAAAVVPRLAHRGMFVDGVTYAAIARNMAEGRGTFWSPRYTATLYPEFHDHPPLGFWLQSLWFRALGDHLFVERAYTLVAAMITAWLIVVMWRSLEGPAEAGRHEPGPPEGGRHPDGWLPLALWIAAPVVSWAIVNNLLETTMTVFTLAAVLCVIQASRARSGAGSAMWAALSGLCVTSAVLTKGPVGLFPLVAPLAFTRLSNPCRLAITVAGQWLTVAASVLMLVAMPDARASLTQYFSQQVVAAVSGEREVSGGALTILRELLQGVLLPMALLSGCVMALAGCFVHPTQARRDRARALLLVGLAGSLPIVVSAKQAGHYLVPAVPFFALASAALLAPTMEAVAARMTGRGATAVKLASILIAVGTVAAAFSPIVGRDRARMADLEAIGLAVPRGETLGLCPEANGDWGLHAWFERRFHASLDASTWRERPWFLKTGAQQPGCPPPGCVPASDLGRGLVLMTCVRPR